MTAIVLEKSIFLILYDSDSKRIEDMRVYRRFHYKGLAGVKGHIAVLGSVECIKSFFILKAKNYLVGWNLN